MTYRQPNRASWVSRASSQTDGDPPVRQSDCQTVRQTHLEVSGAVPCALRAPALGTSGHAPGQTWDGPGHDLGQTTVHGAGHLSGRTGRTGAQLESITCCLGHCQGVWWGGVGCPGCAMSVPRAQARPAPSGTLGHVPGAAGMSRSMSRTHRDMSRCVGE